MMIKLSKFLVVSIFITLLALIVVVSWFFLKKDIHILFDVKNQLKSEGALHWNNKLNVEQSFNACGPYSTMAYLFVSTGELIDPETINKDIGGRHENGLTFPWGINEYLNQHNSKSHIYYLGLLNKEKKIDWIKEKIIQGHPVIVMIGTAEWAHYITILGFKDDTIFKYDSSVSGDLNGEDIGNSNADFNWIIEGIDGVRFHGWLPTYLAISN